MFIAMIGWPELIVILAIVLLIPLGLLLTAFWIWMLVHAVQNKGLSDGEKVAWVLVIALMHLIGSVLYFFIGRPKARPSPPIQPAPA